MKTLLNRGFSKMSHMAFLLFISVLVFGACKKIPLNGSELFQNKNSKSKNPGKFSETTDAHKTEYNCTFQTHLNQLKASSDPIYFITDIDGSPDFFKVYSQYMFTTFHTMTYGREGCFYPKEAWDYIYSSENNDVRIRIAFYNHGNLHNLDFMKVGTYTYDVGSEKTGPIQIEATLNGTTYSTLAANNDIASGSSFEVTEYNSLGKVCRIAFRFNATLRSDDNQEIRLSNAVCRNPTMPE